MFTKNGKRSICLDFNFNYLSEPTKQKWNNGNTPEHCILENGLSLFVYCKNKACKLYGVFFVVGLGYGQLRLE